MLSLIQSTVNVCSRSVEVGAGWIDVCTLLAQRRVCDGFIDNCERNIANNFRSHFTFTSGGDHLTGSDGVGKSIENVAELRFLATPEETSLPRATTRSPSIPRRRSW